MDNQKYSQRHTHIQTLYKNRFQWKHVVWITLRPILACMHTFVGACVYSSDRSYVENPHILYAHTIWHMVLHILGIQENVISMHADNKYRMMEMRKTLNQIIAKTTKSQTIEITHTRARAR